MLPSLLFFYQPFPSLILLSEIYDYFCRLIIMEILEGANMCPLHCVLMKEEGNGFEEVNLAGPGMQVIELEIQVSVSGVLRISSDAVPILQFV